jgi:hypothetical protein
MATLFVTFINSQQVEWHLQWKLGFAGGFEGQPVKILANFHNGFIGTPILYRYDDNPSAMQAPPVSSAHVFVHNEVNPQRFFSFRAARILKCWA